MEQASSESRKGNHSSNYTDIEDVQLCKSWLNISTDPIVGNEQRASLLWDRIKENYDNQLRDNFGYIERFGLKNRWSTINRSVSTFVKNYNQAMNLNASGSDRFDVVNS